MRKAQYLADGWCGVGAHSATTAPLYDFRATADPYAMRCQNCGAIVRLDGERGVLVCDYCGGECAPPVDEDGVQITGETTHACALCHKPLSTGRIEARDVLYCTACHGILVSMDDFGLLLEDLREHRARVAALQPAQPGAESAEGLHCPLCKGAMDHHSYGGGDLGQVMIDSCEACCQIWLHRGAMGKILTPPETNVRAEAGAAAGAPTHRFPDEPMSPTARRLADLQLVVAALDRLRSGMQ
jgi:Zn-finger nucleic acid-binding protein